MPRRLYYTGRRCRCKPKPVDLRRDDSPLIVLLWGHDRMGDAERFRLVSSLVVRIIPALNKVEGPVLSIVEACAEPCRSGPPRSPFDTLRMNASGKAFTSTVTVQVITTR